MSAAARNPLLQLFDVLNREPARKVLAYANILLGRACTSLEFLHETTDTSVELCNASRRVGGVNVDEDAIGYECRADKLEERRVLRGPCVDEL